MKIDDRIEAPVRDLFSAVVKSNEEEFAKVLRGLSDQASQVKALELAIAVCGFVLIDTYGRRPTASETEEIAQVIVDAGGWVPLTVPEVSKFLTVTLDGKPLAQTFGAENAFFLAFIITGTLLGASPKIGEGEWWFNYLDRVEAAIEATPAS